MSQAYDENVSPTSIFWASLPNEIFGAEYVPSSFNCFKS
jgi:hypothetical protein